MASTMKLSQFLSLLAFVCMFLINLSFPGYSVVDIMGNETDKLAMLAFKSQIIEDPLGVLASWHESFHFCNWTGVSCSNEQERVVSLNLQGKRFSGMLSSSIENFLFINLLDLSGNSFQGEIPLELGKLGRIQNLNLGYNLLGGGFPPVLKPHSPTRDSSVAHG